MKEDDLKSITVTIAGRKFPLKVTLTEEGQVLSLEQELNAKINEFQETYPSRDKLDCVIMTLITHTFDQNKSSQSNLDHQSTIAKIDMIKSLLNIVK